MKFTEEHVEVLERYKEHWETLRTAGFMRNVDRPVFDDLQNVHNEALGPVQYTHWCPSCVADLVRILYTNYEKWQANQETTAEPRFVVQYGGRGHSRSRKNKQR